MPNVKIPSPFRYYTDGNSEVEVAGATAGETIGNLAEEYPGLKQYLYASAGELRPSINIYKGDEDIRHLDGPNTKISDREELSIIPFIAGGCAEGRGDRSIVKRSVQTPVRPLETTNSQKAIIRL
jgi:molybdopterin converting factor small subunit